MNMNYVDTKADLTKVTGAMGDICYVIDEAAKYMLNSKGQWICQTGVSPKIDLSEYVKKDFVEANYRPMKYKVTGTPEGTIVDYTRGKEIRIFCPEDVVFTKQNVGETGNPNIYYATFNVIAPEGAISLKEGDQGKVVDEMIQLKHTDAFGRKYKPMWIALALYNETNDTWTYYGKNSKATDFVGWNYVVEWYDAEGKLIDMDTVRINLSNKDCHLSLADCFN